MKTINISNNAALTSTVTTATINELQPAAMAAARTLENGDGAGNDFLGWLHLPSSIDEAQFNSIEHTARILREDCEYVIAIGIGGSYLGAKAVIEALSDNFAAYKPSKGARVLFAGNNIGEDYLHNLMDLVNGHKFGIIVISKAVQLPSLPSHSVCSRPCSSNRKASNGPLATLWL